MNAGYSTRLGGYYIIVFKDENGAGLGNAGYKMAGIDRNGTILMVKKRWTQPIITEYGFKFMQGIVDAMDKDGWEQTWGSV